ncbi:MAG TPA: PPC domain-containing protein, partial [Candidatus Limnocylindrales bacterium]|nr:PPC domain-containing protein [Candidatus Limnocylindrales bacterium]
MRKKLSPIVLLTLFMLLAAVGVSAQAGGSLVYGSAQVGTISPTAPLVFYSFPASAGDLIAVDVLSLTPGFDPSVSLLSPAQQQIAANDNNPLTGAQDAHLSRRLDADGVYALLVGGVNNST